MGIVPLRWFGLPLVASIILLGGIAGSRLAQAATVIPNGSYAPGLNSIVVQGGGTADEIAAVIEDDSGMHVVALWLLTGGDWLFALPDTPAIDGGLSSFPQTAAAFAVLTGTPSATPPAQPTPPPPPPDGEDEPELGPSTSATVTANGVSISNGDMSVSFPPGALPAGSTVTMTPVPTPDLPEGVEATGQAYEITTSEVPSGPMALSSSELTASGIGAESRAALAFIQMCQARYGSDPSGQQVCAGALFYYGTVTGNQLLADLAVSFGSRLPGASGPVTTTVVPVTAPSSYKLTVSGPGQVGVGGTATYTAGGTPGSASADMAVGGAAVAAGGGTGSLTIKGSSPGTAHVQATDTSTVPGMPLIGSMEVEVLETQASALGLTLACPQKVEQHKAATCSVTVSGGTPVYSVRFTTSQGTQVQELGAPGTTSFSVTFPNAGFEYVSATVLDGGARIASGDTQIEVTPSTEPPPPPPPSH